LATDAVKRHPRQGRRFGLALAGVLVVVGCGAGSSQPQSQSLAAEQTLRFPIAADVGTLDPAQVYQAADIQIAQNLFDGLVRYDDTLNVVPDLATSLPTISPDQRTYTFKLRPNVTFSNGDPVTSRDVLYSWNRAAAAQGPYAADLTPVAGFDRLSPQPPAPDKLEQLLARNDPSVRLSGLSAPDDATVVVKLAQPAGWFLSALALPGTSAMVVDPKVVQKDPKGWWTRPETLVGTGPYRMPARTPGRSLEFEAVPHWWGAPKPTVRVLHLSVVPDAGARETAYELGQYDLNGFGGGGGLTLNDLTRVKAAPGLVKQLLLRTGISSTWVNFNLVHDPARAAGGPFVDSLGQPARDLRMAFALAIDKRKLARAVCRDLLCLPATGGLIPKGLKGYGSDPLAGFDPARARALLKSADPTGALTRGLGFVYDAESTLYLALGDNLQQQWQANLGVQVQVLQEPHEQLLRDTRAGRLVLSRAGWQADFNHPEDWYDNLFGKLAGCPDSNCASGYDSTQFDRMVTQADATPLPTALPMYAQIEQVLSAEAAYVPLLYSARAYMVKPYVRGAGANNLLEYAWNQYQVLQH
jgi:ABC-type oligopeptide transport system substrate-binding subunit